MTDEEKAAKRAAKRAAKFAGRLAALRKAMRDDVAMLRKILAAKSAPPGGGAGLPG